MQQQLTNKELMALASYDAEAFISFSSVNYDYAINFIKKVRNYYFKRSNKKESN